MGARSPSAVASEVYELEVSEAGVLITAQEAHGLFNGVQSLVQLLPPTPMQENIRLSCLKVSSGVSQLSRLPMVPCYSMAPEACTEGPLWGSCCARIRPALLKLPVSHAT